MAWLGMGDHDGGHFCQTGLSPQHSAAPYDPVDPKGTLTRGSLVVETRLSTHARPQTLLSYRRDHPETFAISLQGLPAGGFVLLMSVGTTMRHVTLPHIPDGRTDILRLTYSWDTSLGWGQLALERPERGTVKTVAAPGTTALPLMDLATLVQQPSQRQLDRGVLFFALSDTVEPLGLQPGLAPFTPVDTPFGPVPVSRLRRGDFVYGHTGEEVQVLYTVQRSVPARGSFHPVRLRAPYFGLSQDLHVAPEQKLVLGGSQVEYMFGKEAVLVPARHLVNGVAALYADSPQQVTYHQLILPQHQPVTAAGTQFDTLYLGRMRRKPDQLANSVLAGIDRSRLPEHAHPAWPILNPYEALVLADYRAA